MGVEQIFSFTDWAKDHPSDRLPGDRVDAQFDQHANAIRDLEGRIAKLLRADGKLNHDLLTLDSFPLDLQASLARQILIEAEAQRAESEQLLTEAKAAEMSVAGYLAEARSLAGEVSREFARVLALANGIVAVQEDLAGRIGPLSERAEISLTDAVNAENDAAFAAATAQDWADVSVAWAEHMPDTIPPNILATTAVSGDHWSSRWWANYAASAVGGFLFHYYLGAADEPPFGTPTGSDLQEGMIYFDTSDNIMYVYNGSTWKPFNTPQPAGTSALYYLAAAGQTVFSLTAADLAGRTVTLDPAKNEGVTVYLNGVRLAPAAGAFSGDYTVTKATSTVTLVSAPGLNAIVAVDVLRDPSDLIAGAVAVTKLKKFPFDGTTTTFPLLDGTGAAVPIVADTAQLAIILDGVPQEPGVDFLLAGGGASVQFSAAPAADARNFAIYHLKGF